MKIGYKKQVITSFEDTLEKTRVELSKKGFGIITEIDVKKTFKDKLNVDFEKYVILGACQPDSAHKMLRVDKELGLLLPCNVVVFEENEAVFAVAILPLVVLGIAGNPDLVSLASEIEEKLKRVIDAI